MPTEIQACLADAEQVAAASTYVHRKASWQNKTGLIPRPSNNRRSRLKEAAQLSRYMSCTKANTYMLILWVLTPCRTSRTYSSDSVNVIIILYYNNYYCLYNKKEARGGAVVEALRYKPKIAGSIPDGVIGTFHWHNPSGRTTAMGSTQPLIEMSTRNISWG
jgi:hypothetical protein